MKVWSSLENYRGEWENSKGFGVKIEPISEGSALVDIKVGGRPLGRPWCANMPAESLDATNREDEGLGLEVHLGRDGFSLFLEYLGAGQYHREESISPSISKFLDDQEAEKWISYLSLKALFRRENRPR